MAPDGQSRTIALVTLFGAAGGFLAWLLMATTGGSLFGGWKWYATVPTAIVFGAAAAGIGVYVLANTDMTNLGRGLFFALLCGIFFKPVMQAGYGFVVGAVSQAQAQSSASTVEHASTTLASALQSAQPAPQAQVKAQVQQASGATVTLVQQAAGISDPDLKQKLDNSSATAIRTIANAAPAAPQESVESLLKIGDAAKKNGNTSVTLNVLSALKQIETNARDSTAAAAATKAADAIRSQ